MECPTKLFYTEKTHYANQKIADSFLAALADGGFQVGALARCYFPRGVRVETPNDETAVEITEQYLAQDQITLFEAGFRHDNLLLRADIIVKNGNVLDLYEVKAKSCDFADESGMLNQNGTISSKWKEYLEDVAFQKYVIGQAYQNLQVRAHLMLTDKTSHCPTDGLNQKFRLVRDAEGRRRVLVSDDLNTADLDPQLLRSINVDESCEKVFASQIGNLTFEGAVHAFADEYNRDEKIVSEPTSICKDCEFRLAEGEANGELRSGYRECWRERLGWGDADFTESTVLDIWDFRSKDKLIGKGKIKLSQVEIDDIKPKSDDKPGLSRTERQWKQVEKSKATDTAPWTDLVNLLSVMSSWIYPLHFIDFETSAPVIPFQRGRRPYEGIAFQFSHHTVDAGGQIEHCGEYLNTTPGAFPSFDFVRELKAQLEIDNGTIFRYHSHENTYLNFIFEQLLRENDVPDRDELCAFIQTITHSTEKAATSWTGSRDMVDLYELVKRFDYNPATNGSISLKFVLPATINSSEYLKDKYAQPIYGAQGGIPSKNFQDQIWVTFDTNGRVRDPYKLLPMLFTDETESDYEAVIEMDKIKDGGAAMTAYCKLQFEDIPDAARHGVELALLKYCELDTLAMVMLYESWMAKINTKSATK